MTTNRIDFRHAAADGGLERLRVLAWDYGCYAVVGLAALTFCVLFYGIATSWAP